MPDTAGTNICNVNKWIQISSLSYTYGFFSLLFYARIGTRAKL